ncbi:hypothetical protein [Loigolactobacillus binensis]|uniref:Lipoprotein n=1 Tax=Loigolactobacillus binensis TaxID=2559922 RepID=A0ABW3EE72_9LACO|nr:hypothetical protein [Loigolactobacillus binensis]
MKKVLSWGIITLATLSLAACGDNNAAQKDSSSAAARSSSLAKVKRLQQKNARLHKKAVAASKAKAAKAKAASSSKAAVQATNTSQTTTATSQQATTAASSTSTSQSSQTNTMQNSPTDSTNNKVNNQANAGTTVNNIQQAVALVQAQVGNGTANDPIIWTTMTAGSGDLIDDGAGHQYYWIRGQHKSAQANMQAVGAGSYDGLDYYVYQDGQIVARQ